MLTNAWIRYGWLAVLVALIALWMRVEQAPILSRVQAAPGQVDDKVVTPKPSVVGVLNVDEIWGNYKKYLDDCAVIERQYEDFKEEMKRETKSLQDIAEQYNMQPEGSEAQLQLQLKYNQQKLALKTKTDLKYAEVERRLSEIWHDHYQEIDRVAQQVARERKFDIVLTMYPNDMKRDDRKSVLHVVNRIVVYRKDELDITNEVLARLNQKILPQP